MSNTTTTVLQQLLHLLPRHDFQSFVGQHKADRYTKRLSCWNQLTILLYAQVTEKDSLRDIETGLQVKSGRWHHLGLESAARSTLSRANATRPWQIYESLFCKLLERCQNLGSGTASFSFQNDLYALDSTTIDLCLSLFQWATFKKTKGAIKLHTLFNIRSQIPDMICMTEGNVTDIRLARTIDLARYPRGSIFVFDRGYNDYLFLRKLREAGHHFVIRMKKDAKLVKESDHRRGLCRGVLKDEKIRMGHEKSSNKYPYALRRVTFYDEIHGRTYQFLTDMFHLSSGNIAGIYKRRWDIELFFKWIKQHLRIKTFLGTSKNAVLTQIWVAMIYYLLLYWIRHQTKFKGSLHTLTIMFQGVILEAVQIIEILHLTPKTLSKALVRGDPQLSLF